MAKRIKQQTQTITHSGDGWHIIFDRETRDFYAIVDGAGTLGYFTFWQDAMSAIDEHRYQQALQAARQVAA